MRLGGVFGALALASGCLTGSAALAADWQIATVSGKAYRLVGTDWVRVNPNDPIALGDTVKTLGSGTLTLVRDGVTITISPNSRVQIKERLNGKFTDVLQTAGTADVEVDPAKHIRLAVETPYMAAVVKGTIFSVSTFEDRSETAVSRGRVAVIDVTNRLEADVTAGQKASSGDGQPLSLAGTGTLRTPEAFKGKVVTRLPDGTLVESKVPETQTVNGAGKTVTSHAGGNSDGAGKSEDSSAGGNAGGKSDGGKSDGGKSDGGKSDGGSSSGSSGSSGGSDHGGSDHGGSDHGGSGHGHGSDD